MVKPLRPEHLMTRQALRTRRWQQARYAERIEVDGNLVHPHSAHGQLRSYTSYGCRGPLCYATHRHYYRTGETSLPSVGSNQFTLDDCVTYASDVYPDTRCS